MKGARKFGGILISNRYGGLSGNIYRNNYISGCINGIYTGHIRSHEPLGIKVSEFRIENNVIHNCTGDGIHMTSPYVKLHLRNNIIVNNKGYGINRLKGIVSHGQNDIWGNTKGNYERCTTGSGDISKDPLFAAPSKRDYHLKSKAGRWNPKTKKWVKDNVTSPCIDAGDPKADFSHEPAPNGGRVNVGAYGNTAEASKSIKK